MNNILFMTPIEFSNLYGKTNFLLFYGVMVLIILIIVYYLEDKRII